MEGIETQGFKFSQYSHVMSVGAPTWRGLKRTGTVDVLSHLTDVSRCPDMEGIETKLPTLDRTFTPMSVGAPTWRGLKPRQTLLREGCEYGMSVGAPTWRGLKQGLVETRDPSGLCQ